MSTYTVKTVMPTGKAPHETYGTEYYVQFEEDARPVKLSKKQEPKVGDTMDGDIVDDKYGLKFKKTPFVPGAGNATASPASTSKPAWKDNSDGMRQGMCFNNAANYVATLEFEKALTDAEWASLVFSYARALYALGDLNVAPEGSQEATDDTNPFVGN